MIWDLGTLRIQNVTEQVLDVGGYAMAADEVVDLLDAEGPAQFQYKQWRKTVLRLENPDPRLGATSLGIRHLAGDIRIIESRAPDMRTWLGKPPWAPEDES